MKKIFTLFSLTLFSLSCIAQVTFFDDFEGYEVGDYIGEESDTWTTWSESTGGTEDAAVTDAEAFSGSNSIYFSSTAVNGGPQDVVLPFGQAYDDGLFTLSSQMNVASGKNAYLNIQGNTTIGEVWTLDLNASNGNIVLSEGGATLATASYPVAEWFKWEIVANLTFNYWQLYIDDELAATFNSGYNQVASVDIFPIQNSSFWMDDVSFSWEEFPFPDFNATALGITGINNLGDVESNPIVLIRNNGMETINSVDVELAYDGGTIIAAVTGMNLETAEIYEVEFNEIITLSGGENELTATITSVNGSDTDDFPSDNIYTTTVNPITPALGKRVVAEEGTGTWCGWGPRGMVIMEHLEEEYDDYFIGIAVHNGAFDPMVVPEYDGPLPITGYPGGLVDRITEIDPLGFEEAFLARVTVDPVAYLNVGAQYNVEERFLEVVLHSEFIENVTGDYRLALVLVENEVTGTSSGYAQVNYYSGGESGPMGGYESLPSTVPASQMVYHDVARAITPGFNGSAESLPQSMMEGEIYSVNFEYTLPENWDPENMRIVGLLIAPNGRIDNSFDATISEAVEEGWTDSGNLILGVNKLPEPDAAISLYPNPTQTQSFIDINLDRSEEVSVKITAVNGKLIAEKTYGQLNGAHRLPVITADYAPGIYFVQIRVGNAQKVEKLIVQ